VKTRGILLPIAVAIFVSTLGADAPNAEEGTSKLSPQALREIAQVEAEIDRIEAHAIERLAAPPDNQIQQIELLGKVMLYDKNLPQRSLRLLPYARNGFCRPVSELNRTTGAYPGSVRMRSATASRSRTPTHVVAGVAL
jgi:cytochrome c peroxidase